MTWQCKDFYLSCVVRAAGNDLLDVDRTVGEFCVFIFDIPSKKAEEIISRHWSKRLSLPSRDLIEAINELRTRLHNRV